MLTWQAGICSQRLMTVLTLTTIAAFGSAMTAVAQDKTQDSPNVDWLTGNEVQRFNKLAISAWWSNAEFKDRLMRFSTTQRLAIFLDRRIDPSTMIDMSVQDVTKEQFLWSVAEKFNVGVCRVEDFYYFGPPETAANLTAACDRIRRTTIKKRFKKVAWAERQPLKTDSIVEPKKVLQQLAEENLFRITNPEAIPHDIWTGIDLPKTTLQVRVAMLLVGFGKTFERNEDGSEIKIVDFPTFDSTERTFRDVEGASRLAKKLRQDFPKVKIRVSSNRLKVEGEPMDVALIERGIVLAQAPREVKDPEKTFSMTRQAKRGDVLATAAILTGTKLVFDKTNRELVKTLQEQVTIRVVNASIGDVIRVAIEETDLNFEIVDDELRITNQ